MLNELQPNLYYPECEDGEVKTYMMTNRQRYKGAVGMLRLDLLKQLAEKEQSDLYIFPSSIHECVLVPVNGVNMTIEELQEMLQELMKVLCRRRNGWIMLFIIIGECLVR